MRAQISLEFLLVVAIFIAVFGLIVPIAVNVYLQAREQMIVFRVQSALERIVAAADELCAFGGGSRRSIEISFSREIELNASGHVISAFNISRTAICEFEQFSANFTTRELLLSNEGGKIKIS